LEGVTSDEGIRRMVASDEVMKSGKEWRMGQNGNRGDHGYVLGLCTVYYGYGN